MCKILIKYFVPGVNLMYVLFSFFFTAAMRANV